VKDKTFIFGDYEGVRQSKSQSANVNVPSANARHSGPLLNGNVGDIRVIFFDGGAKYNSFQSQFQVKGLRGFMGQASFTLGKRFDDGSGAQLGDLFLTSVPSLIFFDKRERHGRCDFDAHKNLSINILYDFGIRKTDSDQPNSHQFTAKSS
jgi:hypothetical protein